MPDKDEVDVLLDSALATYADPGPEAGLKGRVLAAVAAKRAFGRERRAGRWWRYRLAWAISVPLAATLLFWVAMGRMHQARVTQTQQAHQAHQTEREHAPSMSVPSTMTANHRTEQKRPSGAKAPNDSAELGGTTEVVPFQNSGPRGLSQWALKSCPVKKLDSEARIAVASISCPATAQTFSAGTQIAAAPPLPKLDVFPTPQPLTAQERALVSATTEAPAPVRRALVDAQIQDDVPIHIAAIHIPPVEPLIETQR